MAKSTRDFVRKYVKAAAKASREEEIRRHGRQVSFRSHVEKSAVKYDRNAAKKALKGEIEENF